MCACPVAQSKRLADLSVFLGPVNRAEPLHVLFNVLLGLVLHILITLKVFRILASL